MAILTKNGFFPIIGSFVKIGIFDKKLSFFQWAIFPGIGQIILNSPWSYLIWCTCTCMYSYWNITI